MNPYNIQALNTRFPPMRSASSPTSSAGVGQMGVAINSGMMGDNSSMGPPPGTIIMSRDPNQPNMFMTSSSSSNPSTPPPQGGTLSDSNSGSTPGTTNPITTSMGGGGGSGNGANNTTGYVGVAVSTHIVSNNSGGGNSATTVGNRTTAASSGNNANNANTNVSLNREQVYAWIQELSSPDTREHALIELSRKREMLSDLAPMLWHSFGTMSALLQEIVMIYPVISPPNLTAQQSNRVCNALALLQCVASHPETRSAFLNAHIPLFLYPFLHTVSKSRPFEYLRLTSLGVVGALVKTDEQDVINFLLTTEIIPLCLRIMESGSELSKTVATFILQKILLDETGLSYICQTFERFSHVSTVLAKMVQQLGKEPSARLLKHVVRCYLRLSDNPRAREALRACLPEHLKDSTFIVSLKDDGTTKKWLSQLMQNLNIDSQVVPISSNVGAGLVTPSLITAIQQ